MAATLCRHGLVAAFTDRVAGRTRRLGSIGRRLHQASGVIMIVMGAAMISGHLSMLSYWLLDTFPVLGRIG